MSIPLQKPAPSWQGYAILRPQDADQLEAEAALAEFRDGLPTAEAERVAHEKYRRQKLIEAAAHHLRGIRGAIAVGDTKSAQKHAVLYKLATQSLGGEEVDAPLDEVQAYMDEKPGKYRFASHKADVLADQELLKSEDFRAELTKTLKSLG